ncbi:pyroglutamyl-peptidase I [Opitutaceae bacterium]
MTRTKPDKAMRTVARARTILVTGFEPFGDEPVNPSQEIARQLHGLVVGRRHQVVAGLLPCVFGESRRELRWLMKRHDPEIVICLGLAAGRGEVMPERVAINVDDARIADNAGAQPIDRPIVKGGPAAYWSTLPIKAIVAALQARGIPAAVSQTAGTFVCNHVFYGLMHELVGNDRRRTVRGGFIHVPCMRGSGEKRPALPLEVMVEAVSVAIATTLAVKRDTRVAGGRIS